MEHIINKVLEYCQNDMQYLQDNFNEYMFYLSIMLYDKYLKDKNILLDIYILF